MGSLIIQMRVKLIWIGGIDVGPQAKKSYTSNKECVCEKVVDLALHTRGNVETCYRHELSDAR